MVAAPEHWPVADGPVVADRPGDPSHDRPVVAHDLVVTRTASAIAIVTGIAIVARIPVVAAIAPGCSWRRGNRLNPGQCSRGSGEREQLPHFELLRSRSADNEYYQ